MARVYLAGPNEAPLLIELYCKALRAIAMDKEWCVEERRDEFIKWLEGRCIDQAFWVIGDDKGPFALAHFEREKNEIVTVVVRDGIERKGVATELVRALQAKETSYARWKGSPREMRFRTGATRSVLVLATHLLVGHNGSTFLAGFRNRV